MAKDRRVKETEVKGAKPITWYAAPKDRNAIDEIALAEETRDGRPCGVTHAITLAVRAFVQLYKSDPNHALSLARNAQNHNQVR